MKGIHRILRAILPYKWRALINIVCNLLSALFSLFSIAFLIPFLGVLFGTAPLVSEPVPWAFQSEAISHNVYYTLSMLIAKYGRMMALVGVISMVLIASLFKTLFAYLAFWHLAPIRHGVVRDLRESMFNKILSLPLSYYSEERKGDLISKMTNDVTEVETSVIRSLEMFFRNPIMIIVHLAGLLFISVRLTCFVFVLLPISGFCIGRLGRNLRHQSVATQSYLGALLSITEETLGGLRIIKAFRAEPNTEQRFDKANNQYMRMMMHVDRRRDLASPLSEFLGTVVMGIVLWYGGTLVLGDNVRLLPEALIGFMGLFYMILNPAKSFASAYFNIQKGLASLDRIDTILQANNPIKDPSKPLPPPQCTQSIEFKNVHFSYDDTPVLQGINLNIEHGMTVALVGPSGAGKTTLVDLLPRFYDIDSGAICIDGIDIRDIRIHDLRALIGIVNQDPILFNDSFYSNIAFGDPQATPERVEQAARMADAHNFIMETPDQYQTLVGERGSKLSGGQRQRISIARAILRNPPIMILDEATSALDTHSERAVQEALLTLMRNRTSIVIAHRLSTILHADKICVMQAGRICEMGTHNDLLSQEGLYASLYREGYVLSEE